MKKLIFILVFATTITACGSQKPSTTPSLGPEVNALSLQNAGDYLAAAEEYQLLAEQYPDKAYLYQLNAVDNFLRGNSTVNAKKLLDNIQVPETEKIPTLKLAVLYGKYYSINQQTQQALDALDILPPLDAPRHLLKQYHQLRADAFILLDKRLAGVNELMLVESYTDSSIDKNSLHLKLWDTLITFPSNDLKSQTLGGQSPSVAWYKLASIFTESQFDSEILRSRVNAWQEEYPNHPANQQIIADFLDKSLMFAGQAKNIALLLPFTGSYKDASSAIREGFVAAWYENKNNSNIKVYNANSLNIASVYQQAVSEGADIIIGPLEKEAIKTLISQGMLSVRTIVLNHIDKSSLEEKLLFQFGLSPEDEARQVAKRAFAEGHKTAIVIRPNNSWGERIYHAFAEELSNLGGEILDHTTFDTNSRELSAPVKLILDINASDARGKLLRSKLNRKIYTEPQSRKDADFIFTAGTGNMGSLLLPQLWFFQASPLPMYATSHIYSGTRDKQANIDLNGLKIVDMPWIVEAQHEASIIQEKLNRNWNQQNSSLRRLYAFGIDTYRLINELGKMSVSTSYSIKGETGYLQMDQQRRIYRNLSWVSIQDGEPVLDKAASF